MNVTELARRLKIGTTELRELLPQIGYDKVGSKAIKIHDKLAFEIIQNWRRLMDNHNKKKAYEKEKLAEEMAAEMGEVEKVITKVTIPAIVTVKQFTDILNLPLKDVINELMRNGILASMNERLDYDTAAIIATELGYETELYTDDNSEDEKDNDKKLAEIIDKHKEDNCEKRSPIIVVMGHVDHGKTRLLDTIRKTNVIEGEAGGITQHIGAYQVEKKDHVLTFIDTPGHEAFTAMRSRGAKIADIAILIVAADDGVKPQTIEAIKIIEQSGIPMIVAINKIDKDTANIEKVKQELAQYNIVGEEWGGNYIMAPISAKFDKGIDELLDSVLLIAEMEAEKLLANPKTDAVGTIIESHVDKNIGPVATMLVHSGTLKQGDHLILNNQYFGKIKSMRDYTGANIKTAGPSVPAQIIGFKISPSVGDIAEAHHKIDKKQLKNRVKKSGGNNDYNVLPSSIVCQNIENSNLKKLNIILKCDMLGSMEAIIESLAKIENKEVKANIINKGLGNITENDIWQAQAGNALIIGFHVNTPNASKQLADEQSVKIKHFKIIYDLIDFVEARMEELLGDEVIKENLGKAKVLAIFKKEHNNVILGAKVLEGMILYKPKEATFKVNVLRKGEFITEGKLAGLRVGKETVNEVDEGHECGLQVNNAPEIEIDDTLEIWMEKTKKKTLLKK